MRKMFTILSAAAMVATPTLAAAAPAASATRLSVANVRAATPTARSSKLAGFGIIGLVLLAGIIAIPVVAAVKDDNNDSN